MRRVRRALGRVRWLPLDRRGMSGVRPATLVLAVAAALAASMLGPAESSQGAPGTVRAAAPRLAPAADPAVDGCDLTSSVPASRDESGPKVQQIKQRGTLVVGVDQNSYHWGYRDPQTGQIQGFDIDLARAVAKAILGDPDRITFRTVPTDQRIQAVQSGEVDLLIRITTISCDRLQQVAFSTPYFRIWQSLVVPKSVHATTDAEALRGRRVCVADQSSSQTELQQDSRGAAQVRVVENQLDCLVLMQLGQVDATLTDSELAAAQVAQDPNVQVIGEHLDPGYLGIAMRKQDTDLVARVNAVLPDYLKGDWQQSYAHWLAPTMGQSPTPYLP